MASIMEQSESTVTGTEPVDIVVPYTTPQLTRLALKKAEELASEIPSRIRVLRMQRVFSLNLRQPSVPVPILREQTRQAARGIQAAEITIYLTRDPEETLLKTRPGDRLSQETAPHKSGSRICEKQDIRYHSFKAGNDICKILLSC